MTPGTHAHHDELAVLLKLKWRILAGAVHHLVRGNPLRLGLILALSAGLWVGLFYLFFGGFTFLDRNLTLDSQMVGYLLGLFFVSLIVMLMFSNGVILYSGLFQSAEAALLLVQPLRQANVFACKFVEAMVFSSWAFLLMGSPLMIAYGIVAGAPWYFYALIVPYFLPVVVIPGALGAMLCLLIVNVVPRRRRQVFWTVTLLACAAGVWVTAAAFRASTGTPLTPTWWDSLVSYLRFTQDPLLPSRWISVGLIAAARGQVGDTVYYLLLLTANAWFAYLVAVWLAGRLYRRGYSRIQATGHTRRFRSGRVLAPLLHRVFFFIPRPVRLLILKDLRTFRRDPVQWSQFLIFFGLLALYFYNVRRLHYDIQHAYWRNLVSFLNLSVTALILATFMSRFVFPLLSLEGRKFWILGLLPVSRESILYGKFLFAAGGAFVVTAFLVLFSDVMLRIEPAVVALHLVTVLILCAGLAGISVGLGARLPNLREDNPSKIAAGFGGTLNLAISMVFIFAVVTLTALPCHLYYASQYGRIPGLAFTRADLATWTLRSVLAAVSLGLVATALPLHLGVRALRRMEF